MTSLFFMEFFCVSCEDVQVKFLFLVLFPLYQVYYGGNSSVELIGNLLFGFEEGPKVLNAVWSAWQPLVNDWDCLKYMVRTLEERCGPLTQYGMKHLWSVANICNAGVREESMDKSASQACTINALPLSDQVV
jgi:hypothetical protein